MKQNIGGVEILVSTPRECMWARASSIWLMI